MRREIPLIAPSRYTLLFLYVLALGCSGFLFYMYIGSTDGLASDKASMQLPGLLLMVGLVASAFGGIWFALRRCALILTDTALIFRTGFYGRTLPRSSLQLDSAIQVSLVERRELAPRWRTNGIGLPGLRAGWFRLRNNERSLVYLTDPFRVTYLPTREGYTLLISTTGLLEALREEGTATPDSAAAPGRA